MQQNATDEEVISEGQRIVIDLILTGRTITDAAELAGVDRSTIHRWQHSAAFVCQMNARRSEMKDAADLRLQAMADMAVGAVEDAILNGDVKTAITVLKGLGWLDETRRFIGPTTAVGVTKQWEDADKKRKDEEFFGPGFVLGLS